MKNSHYEILRERIERELEIADKGNSTVKLAACQYVRGIIDTVRVVDKRCFNSLQNILIIFTNDWAINSDTCEKL